MFRIINSESGRDVVYQYYDIPKDCTVYKLKKMLEISTNIAFNKMVILTKGGKLLMDKHHIEDYSNEKKVYLFNKSAFISLIKSESFTINKPEKIEYDNSVLEIDEQIVLEKPFENSFTKGLFVQNMRAEKVLEVSEKRFKQIELISSDMHNQYEALLAAFNNLESHVRGTNYQVKLFLNAFYNKSKKFQKYSDEFEQNIKRLSTIPLHESIQKYVEESSMFSSTVSSMPSDQKPKKTLLDCVPEESLKQWVEVCCKELEQFEGLIQEQGTSKLKEVLEGVDKINKESETFIKKDILERSSEEAKILIGLQKKDFEQLNQEYEIVLPSLNKLGEPDPSNFEGGGEDKKNRRFSGMVQEVFGDRQYLQKLFNERDRKINELRHRDRKIYEVFSRVWEMKVETTQELFRRLKEISNHQYQIKKLKNKLSIFKTIVQNFNEKFAQIELIYFFPGAYYLSLLEIVRRQEYQKTIKLELRRARNRIQRMRTEEMKKRKRFKNQVRTSMPRNLLPGLLSSSEPDQVLITVMDENFNARNLNYQPPPLFNENQFDTTSFPRKTKTKRYKSDGDLIMEGSRTGSSSSRHQSYFTPDTTSTGGGFNPSHYLRNRLPDISKVDVKKEIEMEDLKRLFEKNGNDEELLHEYLKPSTFEKLIQREFAESPDINQLISSDTTTPQSSPENSPQGTGKLKLEKKKN